jgi:helicase
MRIRNLEIYNVPSYILDIWEKNYSPYLLPVQKKVVKDYDILNFNNSGKTKPHSTTLTTPNNNLLVIAPPSSGKTLIGEMAAITHAIHQQKAIYLVPFPFMAKDKYNYFKQLYTSRGLNIVISSRTRKEEDHKIINGDYDLAVVVYEKFNYFLLMYPGFLKEVSLLIIDEMQMINDYRKGPLLKSMINIIRNGKLNLKIIALSALTAKSSSLK